MSTKINQHLAFYCSSSSWGGLEMNTIRYAQWMQECGFSVTLFCIANSPILSHAQSTKLNIVIVNRNKKYADLPNAIRVMKHFKKLQIDWVWFRDTRDMALLALAKRLSGNGFKLLYQQAMQLGVNKKNIFHTLRFNAIDVWVSTLPFLKKQVEQRTHFPSSKIFVVPLGTDDQLMREQKKSKSDACQLLGLNPERFIVGIVGRIDPLKGQHTLINALQLMHDENIHVIIVGESTKNESNHYELELKQKVRSLGLQHVVSFFPYSNNVATYYSAMDVFVMASKGETFGTVTIEAMSMGLPVVGTNASGTPEILDHGKAGLLFEPDNADELSQCIATLKSDIALRQSLSKTAQQRFNTYYSKAASVAQLKNILLHHS